MESTASETERRLAAAKKLSVKAHYDRSDSLLGPLILLSNLLLLLRREAESS